MESEVGLQPGDPHGTVQQPEIATLLFNDGSNYTGTLKNGIPHGLGTCVWKDGNQYDGEWRNGLMHGFGTYLWTSGQRYDGEWKDGKREGVGVKMYADGSTFHGIWRDGKKHGVGVFKPASKDKDKDREKERERDRARNPAKTSSGRLLGAMPDGESVSNLNAYEAAAQRARPDAAAPAEGAAGVEAVRAASESSAAAPGPTSAGPPAPAPPADASFDREGPRGREREGARDKEREREKEKEKEREGKLVIIRVFDDGQLLREQKLSSDDAKMIFGQQPQPVEEKEKGRGRKARKKVKRALGFGKKLQQKHGQLLYKGMPGYNLMLRLQQGIRWSIGRGSYGTGESAPQASPLAASSFGGGGAGGPLPLSHVLAPSDFTHKVKAFFPSAGSHITPAHPAGDFKWKDYSPRVFRNLRNMYGIADADYMLSLGGSSALWQLNSPGKSGCMFFLSDDERFLIKTMRKTEIRTLIDMLPKYYRYMEAHPRNLVIRFFGVHGVKQVHGRTVRFVVMHNMFNTDLQIHKKFDLKGSTDGRTTGPTVDPNDPKTVFKDLDLDLKFVLEPTTHAALISQIHSDAAFLRTVEVMDYSLLLGIHFCTRARLGQESDGPQPQGQGQQGQREPGTEPAHAAVQGEAPAKGKGGGGGGGSGGGAPGAAGTTRQQALLSASSQGSLDGEGAAGQRPPSGHNGVVQSPGGAAAARPGGGGGGGGEDPDAEHVRNFDLFSTRADLDKQLRLFEERMRGLDYEEQRIQDILSLARLRILGDQLKKRSKKAYKVYDGPGAVLNTLASRRHEAEVLPRLEEADEGGSDEEEEAAPAGPKQPQCLGYQMRALAVHSRGDQPPEEVVLCFGIIDILQDWNVRKVFERTLKSIAHDSLAISVAPPKLYSLRFAEFLTKHVFMDPAAAAAKGLRLPPPSSGGYGVYSPGVRTVVEEEEEA